MLYETETRRILVGFRLNLTFDESLNIDKSCIFVDVSKTKTVGLLLNTIIERFHLPRNSYLTVENYKILPSESVCVLLDVNSVKINGPATSTSEVRETQTSEVSLKDNASEETGEVISCNEGDVERIAFPKPRSPKRPARDGIVATLEMLLEEVKKGTIGKECDELSLSIDISKKQPESHPETMNVDVDEAEIDWPAEDLSDHSSDGSSDLNIEKKKRKRKHGENLEPENQPPRSSTITVSVNEVRQDTNNPRPRQDAVVESQGAQTCLSKPAPNSMPPSIQSQSQELLRQTGAQKRPSESKIRTLQSYPEETQRQYYKSSQIQLKFQLETQMRLKQQLLQQSQPTQLLQPQFNSQMKLPQLQQQQNIPMIPPSGNPNVSSEFVRKCAAAHIWQGVLEWKKLRNPSMYSLEPSYEVPCSVFTKGNIGEFDLNTEQWPAKLSMILLPKEFLRTVGMAYLKNSTAVLFNFWSQELAAHLNVDLGTDYVGYVQLSKVIDEIYDLQVLILVYNPHQKVYVGIIPKDQDGFIYRCWYVSQERNKSYVQQLRQLQLQKKKPSPAVGIHSSFVQNQSGMKQPTPTRNLSNATLDQSSLMEFDELCNAVIPSCSKDQSSPNSTMNQVKQSVSTAYVDQKENSMSSTLSPLSKSVDNAPINQSAVNEPNQAARISDASNSLSQNVKIEGNRKNDLSEQMEASSNDGELVKRVKLDGTRIHLRKSDGTWTVLTPEIADTELAKLEVPKENQSIVFRISYSNRNCVPTLSQLFYGQIVSCRANTNKLAIDIPHQFVQTVATDCLDEVLPGSVAPITGSTFEIDLSILIEPKVIS